MNRFCDVCESRLPIAVEPKVFIGGLQYLLTAFVVRWTPLPGNSGGVNDYLLLHGRIIIAYD